MISGFVDDTPAGDGFEHGKRLNGFGRYGQRVCREQHKVRIVSGSDGVHHMVACAALGGIDGIGFEGVERGDSLIWAENTPRRGCAVDGGMDGALEYRELGVFFEQALGMPSSPSTTTPPSTEKSAVTPSLASPSVFVYPMWRSGVWKAQKRASIRNDEEANASSISA